LPRHSPGFLFLLAAGAAAAITFPPEVGRSVEYSYRQQYDSAGIEVQRLLARDPSDPVGTFGLASLLQLYIYDSGRDELSDSFYLLCDKTIVLCRRRLRTNTRDAAARFYAGMTLLNRARYLAWQGRASAALKAMLGVIPELNAALDLDPGAVDAWFGLGMVEFFKSQSSRYTLGLPVLGSRRKAREMVSRAAAGDGIFRTAAQQALAFMLKEDEDFAACEQVSRALLSRYPGNRSALRTLRDSYLKAGRFMRAIETGRTVDRLVRASFPDNLYGLSENWIVTAKAWNRLGLKDSARVYADSVLAYEQQAGEVPWLKTYIPQAREISRR
jgi:tetratricopeptide (TPR) repeat protein